MLADTATFQPLQVGHVNLSHRIVHAPTTRSRSTPDHVPTDIMLQYYDLRSKYPGSLIVFESTLISEFGGLTPRKPAVFSSAQQHALGQIFDRIHANKSFVSVQLMATGRMANVALQKKRNVPYTAPSAVYLNEEQKRKAEDEGVELEELSIDQIHQLQEEFVLAAKRCVEAGADFVELHGTSGFLIEQFLSPTLNFRTDQYGGSPEKRARFLFEIIDTLSAEIGLDHLAVRLGPWSTFNVDYATWKGEKDPALKMSEYVVRELESNYKVAYLSVVEPRVSGNADVALSETETNDSILKLWSGVLLRSGAYATHFDDSDSLLHYSQLKKDVQDGRTLIGFARPFTSNPDLVERMAKGLQLTAYDRKYFYTHAVRGYLTFGNLGEEIHFKDAELEREGVALA